MGNMISMAQGLVCEITKVRPRISAEYLGSAKVCRNLITISAVVRVRDF